MLEFPISDSTYEVEIHVICAKCGKKLESKVDQQSIPNVNQLFVIPCPNCCKATRDPPNKDF